jgi:predicted nucleic acid-binding protein
LALYYLETSGLVKLYVREPGTDRLLTLATRSANNRFTILSLAQVEFRSAVRRREKNDEIPRFVATQLIETFKTHLETRFTVQVVNDFVLDLACALVDRYALRAFDAIQLAGYVSLRSATGTDVPVFVCADQDLLAAAKEEGASILNPLA